MTRSASTPRVRLTLCYFLALLAAAAFCAPRAGSPAWLAATRIAALLLIALACLGRIWCSVFIAGRKDTAIVIDGPYALVRHPLYVLSFLGGIGLQFEVDGLNVIYTLPVAPWEAALGASVSVPTLGGPVQLKVPADSESGRKLRLRGRGLPDGRDGAGDQIVELEILAPRARSESQRKAYATMRDAFGSDWQRE